MNKSRSGKTFLILLAWLGTSLAIALPSAGAGEIKVAVATNFYKALREISRAFEQETGHRVLISSGSTGKLYAQIVHGAPFELFLAADSKRPGLLEKSGQAVGGTRFTYAMGRLTLWSPDANTLSKDGVSTLKQQNFKHIALANPKTAPYGTAARQTLQKLGLWEKIRPLLVQGENIGQAYQFVATRNVELGFVALSQVLDPQNPYKGSRWDVPKEFHDPLQQDAVLLKKAEGNPEAKAFWKFLQSQTARRIIDRYGYQLP